MNRNKYFLLLLLTVFSLFNISASFSATPLVGLNAVYNGDTVTSDNQFPFVVGIYEVLSYIRTKDTSCTGSIIGKQWVLIAAHCVSIHPGPNTPIDEKSIVIGTGYTAKKISKANKLIHVKKVFLFNDTFDVTHDVALLQLTDVTDISPVVLPAYNEFPNLKTSHLPATAVGYGMVLTHYDKYLHYGDEIIQDDQTVEALLQKGPRPDVVFNPISMLGSTSPDSKSPLSGDSGGPLLLTVLQPDNSKKYVQVGITSWGTARPKGNPDQQDLHNFPAIYANLTDPEILDFINKTIKNNP